jgi:hypothetical protein
MKLKQLAVNLMALALLSCMTVMGTTITANATIPAWLLKKMQDIKPQPASMNPVIIPGWKQQQAQVLAESFITGKVDSVEAGVAEDAMSEVGVYKGNKSSVIVAKGSMVGNYPVGPHNLTNPEVRIVFDNNGNVLKREFPIPFSQACSDVDRRMAKTGGPVTGVCIGKL